MLFTILYIFFFITIIGIIHNIFYINRIKFDGKYFKLYSGKFTTRIIINKNNWPFYFTLVCIRLSYIII